jgi:hypothetical protein
LAVFAENFVRFVPSSQKKRPRYDRAILEIINAKIQIASGYSRIVDASNNFRNERVE